MSDVWEIPIPAAASKERTGYPTQKPEKLLERLVLALTNEGNGVLDPMCGSGTTIAVAARLGRRAIGIDASKSAVTTARARLERMNAEEASVIMKGKNRCVSRGAREDLGRCDGDGDPDPCLRDAGGGRRAPESRGVRAAIANAPSAVARGASYRASVGALMPSPLTREQFLALMGRSGSPEGSRAGACAPTFRSSTVKEARTAGGRWEARQASRSEGAHRASAETPAGVSAIGGTAR